MSRETEIAAAAQRLMGSEYASDDGTWTQGSTFVLAEVACGPLLDEMSKKDALLTEALTAQMHNGRLASELGERTRQAERELDELRAEVERLRAALNQAASLAKLAREAMDGTLA